MFPQASRYQSVVRQSEPRWHRDPSHKPFDSARCPWRPLLDRALGDDHIDLFQGAVIAEPGAADQQPHMDGGHLYQGTHGYERGDGRWLVAQGADYIKEDSCGGSQDHATAFADYATMRDTLNATGAARSASS